MVPNLKRIWCSEIKEYKHVWGAYGGTFGNLNHLKALLTFYHYIWQKGCGKWQNTSWMLQMQPSHLICVKDIFCFHLRLYLVLHYCAIIVQNNVDTLEFSSCFFLRLLSHAHLMCHSWIQGTWTQRAVKSPFLPATSSIMLRKVSTLCTKS